MTAIRSITVFCSSSSRVAPLFARATAELGAAIAREGWRLVYGGNAVGMMGVLADACRAAGGRVVGVTPKLFIDKCVHDDKCEELIVTACMRERKAKMEALGDAFIALPGGLGTFEEFFEIVCGRQLAYHNKPIVLLNIDGFYDPLLGMIERGLEMGFIRPRARGLFFVAASVEQAIAHLRSHVPTEAPASSDLSFEAAASRAAALD